MDLTLECALLVSVLPLVAGLALSISLASLGTSVSAR